MSNYDSLSLIWSDEFFHHSTNNIIEQIFNESIDVKYSNIKLAYLRQVVFSRHQILGEGVELSKVLADEFKFDFDSVFEYYLLKWVAYLNYLDEITNTPEIQYDTCPDFNSIKFYNFLQESSIENVISKLSDNFALFTELLYFQRFFKNTTIKVDYMITLLMKKICIFALVWVEKDVFNKISPMSKNLAEIVINAKLYAIILSLPITTHRKMFGFFALLGNKKVETAYEIIIPECSIYKSIHDLFYTNLIVSMYEYDNGTKSDMRKMKRKNIRGNFTLNELGDCMYDENACAFKDTSIYERLDDKSILLTEKELFADASSWFRDLTKQQKIDLLPFLSLNRGGQQQKTIVHREDTWFVNGGEQSNKMDEWAIWKRYITLLTVQYLETIEQNDMDVEVIIFYLYFYFLYFIDGFQ